jgi:uncharacterized membrane protein
MAWWIFGLGVYMTRVRKIISFDKMFAVFFSFSAISLLLMFVVYLIAKAVYAMGCREEGKAGHKGIRTYIIYTTSIINLHTACYFVFGAICCISDKSVLRIYPY